MRDRAWRRVQRRKKISKRITERKAFKSKIPYAYESNDVQGWFAKSGTFAGSRHDSIIKSIAKNKKKKEQRRMSRNEIIEEISEIMN